MATAQMNRVLRHVRMAAFAGPDITNGQLLERYLSGNDEAAFEVLVRRLGPMVLGVCHRVLGNAADADDAFQATFLVLVRKATAVRPRERVGDRLHGVAYRTALKARCTAAKRRVQEARLARSEAVPAAIPDDWRAVLDQELQRLPEKYRSAVLLCDLGGKTRKEAARQLGWAVATLSTRLARARSMLLGRLSRRGVALSMAAFSMGLARSSAAWVPPRLIAATVQAQNASILTPAAGAVSAKVAVLMEGVMKSMVLTKLKNCVFSVLLGAGMLGLGLGGYQALPAEEPTQKNDAKAALQDNKGAQAALQLDFLKRPVCHFSLSECIAFALENCLSEGKADTGTGPRDRNERNTITERIRVLAINPGAEEPAVQLGLPLRGVCLARLDPEMPRPKFELRVNNLLLKTECAYWNLYQAYGYLYTYEEILRLDHKAWQISRANDVADRRAPQEFFPIHAQYEEFRGERLKAIAAALEAERALRGIIGMSENDGRRLVPVTEPCLARYRPNWKAAEEDALALRPELVLARQKVKRAQLNLQVQKNSVRPELRFMSGYAPASPNVDLAIIERERNIIMARYQTLVSSRSGAPTLNAPLGFRHESAAMRSARLELAKAYYALLDEEERVVRALAKEYQKISEWHRRIEIARAERKAYADTLADCSDRARTNKGDRQGRASLVLTILQYHRSLALACLKEYEAITEYNNTLARFAWVKGEITQHHNVMIEDGPLPQNMQVRAVEAERARTRALLRKLKPTPVVLPGMLAGQDNLPALDAE